MTISNGVERNSLASNGKVDDYTKALEILKSDYLTGDGLDVETLVDSDKHGALTYNDFLILPGYIGKTPHHSSSA
jgi:IMP dehydrogenase